MSSILFVTINSMEPAILHSLARGVQAAFRSPVEILPTQLDPSFAFDPSRRQYNSSVLLSHLMDRYRGHERVIGITDLDLFVPVLTFVFGEAQLNGSTAVVSFLRLQNNFYGLLPDPHLEIYRLEKEVIHELGHTYGLIHCRELECVMRSSTYVEEIDLKPSTFCASCAEVLQQSLPARPADPNQPL